MAKKTEAGKAAASPLVAVIMGSKSDWDTMRHTDETLSDFGIDHECRVISAHRSPSLAAEFGSTAEARGLEVAIAAGGGDSRGNPCDRQARRGECGPLCGGDSGQHPAGVAQKAARISRVAGKKD